MQNVLANKVKTMTTNEIVSSLKLINKSWKDFTDAEREVRFVLLGEYESRNGGDALDALIEELDPELAVA